MRKLLIGLLVVAGVIGLTSLAFNQFHHVTWGSIYIAGGNISGFGKSANASSAAEAEQLAEAKCSKFVSGDVRCFKAATYEDTCSAIAVSDAGSETQYYHHDMARQTADDAMGQALAMCLKDHNDGSCKIFAAGCSQEASSSSDQR